MNSHDFPLCWEREGQKSQKQISQNLNQQTPITAGLDITRGM